MKHVDLSPCKHKTFAYNFYNDVGPTLYKNNVIQMFCIYLVYKLVMCLKQQKQMRCLVMLVSQSSQVPLRLGSLDYTINDNLLMVLNVIWLFKWGNKLVYTDEISACFSKNIALGFKPMTYRYYIKYYCNLINKHLNDYHGNKIISCAMTS